MVDTRQDMISRLAAEVAPEPEWLRGPKALLWNAIGPGILGLEHPDDAVREWQAEHPVLDIGSNLIGIGGATAAGMKALRTGTKYGKWAAGLARTEKMAEAPFRAKFASEAALLAPIETARQGLGYIVQENSGLEGASLEDRALAAAGDTLLGAGIVGGLAKIASGGKRIRLPDSMKDISSGDSWQVNLRKARKILAETTDPLQRNEVEKRVWDLEGKIKTEARNISVGKLEGYDNSLGNLNGLFRGTSQVKSKMLAIHPETGFTKVKDLDDTLAGLMQDGTLPPDWLEYSQFPRLVSGKSDQARKYIDRVLGDNLYEVGNGWSIAKEKDGLYVVARKTLREGDKVEYFLTKTDNPGKFIPEQGQLKAVTEKTAWRDPDTIYKPTGDGNNVLDKSLKLADDLEGGIRAGDVDGTRMWEATKEGAQAFARKTGLGQIAESEVLGNLVEESKRLFAPTAFQFKNSPLARKIYAVSRNTIENAKRKAQEWVYGVPRTQGKSLLRTIATGASRKDKGTWANSVRAFAKEMPEQFKVFLQTLDNQVPYEKVLEDEALRSALGPRGMEVLEQLKVIHDGAIKEITSTAGSLNIPDNKMFPLRQGHYGLSHYWKGSLRQSILDDKGNLVYIVGGDSKKGIRKIAENVIKEASKDGQSWRLGEYWTKAREIDLSQEKLLSEDRFALGKAYAEKYAAKNPGVHIASFFKPQAGVKGYNLAKDAEELIENLTYSLENKYLWMAREINERILAKDLATLGIDSPETALALEGKLAILRGEQGLVSQLVNKTADRVLAPILGTNSASKIVSALNTAHATLDLGFANMAYTMANIFQPITTVLPQLSMLTSCPQALQWAYDGIPLISKTTGRGTIANTLSPMKMMTAGLKLMANPKAEEGFSDFLDWMVREGVISPRFIERYIGENSQIGQTLSSAFKAGDYAGMLKQMGMMLPSFSEQASRGYAASVGYKFFNSMAKSGMLSKDQVYLAAKKFTENTMFQFAASDRALVLQGPVGQAWGLFKNWTMHYVGWQMEYLGAGLKHGCWAPYMYSNLATRVLGGLGSSEVGSLVERFAEWAGDDKMSNLLYDRWGDTTGSQMLLYGLPGAFGFSLQGQVNSPFRDPGEEIQRFMGFVYGNRLKAAWNALGKGIDVWQTSGQNPATNRDFQYQLARAFAPKAIYRQMQFDGDRLLNSRGALAVGDLGGFESAMYKYFNLPSVRIDQGLEISNQIWKDKDKRAQLTSKYSEAMAEAIQSEDGRLMYRVIERALVDGVDVPAVIDAAQTKIQNSLLTPLERNRDYYGVWGSTGMMLGL